MWFPFKKKKNSAGAASSYKPGAYTVSIREQLEVLDTDLRDIQARIGNLGLKIRNDGQEITLVAPPVETLQDAIEFVNTRVDFLHMILDSLEDKLGF